MAPVLVRTLFGFRVAVLAMVAVAQTTLSVYAYAEERKADWDIRCCFEDRDLDNAFRFVIELAGVDQPVGHLSVVTPTGGLVGFDVSSQTFSHITNPQGVYALGPRPQPSIDAPSWNHTRYALLYHTDMKQRPLKEGRYSVRVVGLWSGRYILRFYPFGRQNGTAAEFGTNGGIAIKSGETHEYVFEGRRVGALTENAGSKLRAPDVKRIR